MKQPPEVCAGASTVWSPAVWNARVLHVYVLHRCVVIVQQGRGVSLRQTRNNSQEKRHGHSSTILNKNKNND